MYEEENRCSCHDRRHLGVAPGGRPAVFSGPGNFDAGNPEPIAVGWSPGERVLIYLTEAKGFFAIPDFVSHIHADALKAIKPEAVNIIR